MDACRADICSLRVSIIGYRVENRSNVYVFTMVKHSAAHPTNLILFLLLMIQGVLSETNIVEVLAPKIKSRRAAFPTYTV